MLLDRDRHVAQHRGAARPGHREQVREARYLQAQVAARPGGPGVAQRDAVAPLDVQLQQRPGHGVEAGREDDDVELVLGAVAQAQPVGSDALDRVGPHIHQRHVRSVEGLEIPAVDRRPLGRIGVVDLGQKCCRRGVLHDLADLALDEFRRRRVRLQVGQDIAEIGAELQPALLPRGLVDGLALGIIHVEDRAVGDAEGMPIGVGMHDLPDLVEILPHMAAEVLAQRRVARGDGVVGRALEHAQMAGGGGDHGGGLDPRGPGADLAHALIGEIHARVRPFAGVVPLALEAAQPRHVRHVGRGQAAHGGDQVGGGEALAGSRRHVPQVCRFVVAGTIHAGVEANVPAQVEAVCHMVEVAHDLGLLGVALGELPLADQIIGEGVAVGMAFGIAARAGVAVPVPGAAHAIGRFQQKRVQAQPVAQLVQLVHAGEAGADDQRVECLGGHRDPPRSARAQGAMAALTPSCRSGTGLGTGGEPAQPSHASASPGWSGPARPWDKGAWT